MSIRNTLRRIKHSELGRYIRGNRSFRHDTVPLPGGSTRNGILESLSTLTIDEVLIPELRAYLETDLDRFLYTLGLIEQDKSGKALEIGANPYFMSALARTYRPALQFDYLNYFEGSGERVRQQVAWIRTDGEAASIDADAFNVNIEGSHIPVEDESYDLILFCEVLEHFTMNPLAAIRELHRVLKPGGTIILTTPNVVRMENVIAFLEGRNIYDPYSAYGPHGRHNREYSRQELHKLMCHAGFACDCDFTSDVHTYVTGRVSARRVLRQMRTARNREHDLGQYLFSRWTKTGPFRETLPRWLYRSYPESQMAS